ncbi:MAG TPA: DUF1264 domain-containing protein [Methylococcaceae bacterium]|jgi:hypothetical protein|nr:DUF1264 domain-containing protein [Methylococcaceae bacterium]HIA46200.1 DUF1264 domain-containing protein [Methylococcaceae bacterium]
MRTIILFICGFLLLPGISMAATTHKTTVTKVYNETFNPRQKEYPNHVGFNDLHIQAIRHLKPDTDDVNDPKLQTIVHHHCKAYDDGTLICMMFHSGMKDQDKPIGFEYIITGEQYASLDKAEQRYWHYHKTEIPRAHATLPDLTAEEAGPLLGPIGSTYGKVIYFQKPGDKLPLGEPYILVVQDLPEQD